MSKLERLPNVNATPTYTLRKLLEDVDKVVSVVAIVQWNDGRFQAIWTAQPIKDLAMSLVVANHDIERVIVGKDDAEAPNQPPGSAA